MKFVKSHPYVLLPFLLAATLLILHSCEMDHGLQPLPSIRGHAFIKGIRPEVAGELIVVVAPDFPPKKWTDIIRTPPLDISGDFSKVKADTVEWELPLAPGTYDVAAILWKKHGEDWSFESVSNLLGVYTEPNLFKPKPIELPTNLDYVDSIDIKADFALIRYGAFIKGVITVEGDFRDDTAMLILAAFPMKPETVIDYLFAMGWDLSIPIKEVSYPLHYTLDVAEGYIKYIALFWKGEKGGPYDFKKIGEYMLQDDPPPWPGAPKPEGIWVSEGDTLVDKFRDSKGKITSTVGNFEIIADFDRTY
ncbi:hypothetical protein JXJ21_06825 [candidate division KSB1 bacterium]|nr:hypothetical protein [candidate division KSB1 bacterium]